MRGTRGGGYLLGGEFVGTGLKRDLALVGFLVVILGVLGVEHLGGLTTSSSEHGHTLKGALFGPWARSPTF